MSRSYDVALAGYYGFGNFGDELLARSAIELLLDAGVSRERIAILSNAPEESERRFGVDAFDRWRVSAVRETLSRSRTLLLGGGGLFQDATSVRSCAYYWGLVRLARMLRCRVWAVGQSVGPLLSPGARWLARTAFAGCAYAGVRDEGSRGILTGFGLGCELSPDLTFALDVPVLRARGRVALVNMRPSGDGRWGARVARAARALRAEGLSLRGVAFAPEDAAEMERCAAARGLTLADVATPDSSDAFLKLSEDARAAVGMRLHFGVLSLRRGLPVLLAPYDPKVSGFAAAWGIPLLPDEDNEDDSVIMPLLREGASPPDAAPSALSTTVSMEEARANVRDSFFAAAARLLGDAIHG